MDGRTLLPELNEMTPEDLDALEKLDRLGSSGPWYVRHMDDDRFMSAITVSTHPDTGDY